MPKKDTFKKVDIVQEKKSSYDNTAKDKIQKTSKTNKLF